MSEGRRSKESQFTTVCAKNVQVRGKAFDLINAPMERRIPLDVTTAAPRARRHHTMIRTKPATPSPYLDPIVTRRRSGTECGSRPGGGSLSSSDGAVDVNKHWRVANKQQLESCKVKTKGDFVRHSAGKFSGSQSDHFSQRRKTLGFVEECKESESADLAYLVVNLQGGVQAGDRSSTAEHTESPGHSSSVSFNRRRHTMATTGAEDKMSAQQRNNFHKAGSLQRNLQSLDLEAVEPSADVEQEGTYEEVNPHSNDAIDEDPLPAATRSVTPRSQNTKSLSTSAQSSALPTTTSSARKPSSSLRPPPPPPPAYLPPGPPKREIFQPSGSSATNNSLEVTRDPDLIASCPSLPPKRSNFQKKNLSKASSVGGNSSSQSLEGRSPKPLRKNYSSETTKSDFSPNSSRRPPPRKPPPYIKDKKTPPHPQHSPSSSSLTSSHGHPPSPERSLRRIVSSDVAGTSSMASSHSPLPPVPKKSTASSGTVSPSASSPVKERGLSTSISTPSLHLRSSSTSRPTTSRNTVSFADTSELSPEESARLTTQISAPPRRPAPVRPRPFTQSHASTNSVSATSSNSTSLPTSPVTKRQIQKKKKTSCEGISAGTRDSKVIGGGVSGLSPAGNLRKIAISGPVLKSTTMSLDKSQSVLSVTEEASPEILSSKKNTSGAAPGKNPSSAAPGKKPSGAAPGKNEAIYEDIDVLDSTPGGHSHHPPQTSKPALPSRNKPVKKVSSSDIHPAFSRPGIPSQIGGVSRDSKKEEQVYEDLDGFGSDSDECSTTDNAAYIGNAPLSEAWVTIDDDGLYVDDLYVEMRPGSSTTAEDDNSTYMDMNSTSGQFATGQNLSRPPSSPAPSVPRDSSSPVVGTASPVGGVPAPSSPAPVYEYADLSVTMRKQQKPHKPPPVDSGNSLYYASKNLLMNK